MDETRWYAMLFPGVRGVHPVMRRMAALTGGSPNPDPHVTVGYFRPFDPAADLAAPLRHLAGPAVPIRAAAPYNARYRPDAPTAHTILLRVAPTPALRGWYDAVHDALRPLAAPGWPTWADARPHLHAVRGTTLPPPAAIALLGGAPWEVAFEATTLIVSQRLGDAYQVRLTRPLAQPVPDE